MFLSGEDFYYFTYSILLILDVLGCTNGKLFKDYRKLPFLIEFLNDENLLNILETYSDARNEDQRDKRKLEVSQTARRMNRLDKDYLFKSYSTGMAKRSEVLKILFTLEKSGYVALKKANLQSGIDVTLMMETVPPEFFNKDLFAKEYDHVQRIKKLVKRLPSLTLETMLEKIYEDNGVKTWAL